MRRYEQIVAMKNKGMSFAQIADRMDIAEKSVRNTMTRYGTPALHAAYKADSRVKRRARRQARRDGLPSKPRGWPTEFLDDIVRRREAGQTYKSIARDLDITVGVISGIMHRHRKSSKPEMENA